jgi:hypothetical protein
MLLMMMPRALEHAQPSSFSFEEIRLVETGLVVLEGEFHDEGRRASVEDDRRDGKRGEIAAGARTAMIISCSKYFGAGNRFN